ncbi:adhesin [Pseudomonas hormoni]|uniref:Adhesin n=1 Tax=Pseudomonas hormoni TaxID=3093767 RepID=A0ABX8EUB5_9PSED|nr:CS1 type fimbrial major subunit [Pseudomonas hormoni]QVW22333.1 adhesin [Pseudomonas hormoni]
MFKATLATLSLALLPLSGAVQAITERETFEVSVSIPTAEFYVIPSEPGWIHQEQSLIFNPVSGRLAPLRKNFDVKNTNGGISARLSVEPYLSNGRDSDNIPLIVTFNRKRLSVDADEVVSELDGRGGKRVGLEVAAVEAPEGYQPGSYYGSVHMIFEALAP